eukprot:2378779-Pleurochrysis_carterae.AAC.1
MTVFCCEFSLTAMTLAQSVQKIGDVSPRKLPRAASDSHGSRDPGPGLTKASLYRLSSRIRTASRRPSRAASLD